jgi:hypothetical protein
LSIELAEPSLRHPVFLENDRRSVPLAAAPIAATLNDDTNATRFVALLVRELDRHVAPARQVPVKQPFGLPLLDRAGIVSDYLLLHAAPCVSGALWCKARRRSGHLGDV